ncbi:MAG: NAD-dependent epimerase/dehydratase family protein, partial [Cytophagia bacterium]|nr:NAD-dependent epimerase/dehydratase family protein [Cytophagia bacterium]
MFKTTKISTVTKKNILITGASGLIGKRLTELLLQKGHSVAHLGRSAKKGTIPSFVWNVEQQKMDANALTGIDT